MSGACPSNAFNNVDPERIVDSRNTIVRGGRVWYTHNPLKELATVRQVRGCDVKGV